jgi:hypothetical protein
MSPSASIVARSRTNLTRSDLNAPFRNSTATSRSACRLRSASPAYAAFLDSSQVNSKLIIPVTNELLTEPDRTSFAKTCIDRTDQNPPYSLSGYRLCTGSDPKTVFPSVGVHKQAL